MHGSSSNGHHFGSQLFNMEAESRNIEKEGGSILLTLHAKLYYDASLKAFGGEDAVMQEDMRSRGV